MNNAENVDINDLICAKDEQLAAANNAIAYSGARIISLMREAEAMKAKIAELEKGNGE